MIKILRLIPNRGPLTLFYKILSIAIAVLISNNVLAQLDSIFVFASKNYETDQSQEFSKNFSKINPLKIAIPYELNIHGNPEQSEVVLEYSLNNGPKKSITYVPGSRSYILNRSTDQLKTGDSIVLNYLHVYVKANSSKRSNITIGKQLYGTKLYPLSSQITQNETGNDTIIYSYTSLVTEGSGPSAERLIGGGLGNNPCTGYCGVNLTQNGCFDKPIMTCSNQNFTISPLYNCGNIFPGNYTFGNDASILNPIAAWESTGNTTNFLVIDGLGNGSSSSLVWQQSVPVTAGMQYCFSHRMKNLCVQCGDRIVVELRVNGVPIPNSQSTSSGLGVANSMGWVTNTATWTSTTTGNVDIQIVILQPLSDIGADLGLDDISFRALQPSNISALPVTASASTGTYCEGVPIQLFSDVTLPNCGGTYEFLWTSNPNSPSLIAPNNTLQNPFVEPPTVTTTYTITVSDINGCATGQASVTVQPPSLANPPITILSNTDICQPGPVTLAVIGAAPGSSYLWTSTVFDPSLSGGNELLPNPTVFINFFNQYTVRVTNPNGCVRTADQVIGVIDELIILGPTEACQGEVLIFNVWNSNGLPTVNMSFNWTGIGLPTFTNAMSIIVPTASLAPGTYTYTAANPAIPAGCNSASITFTIGAPLSVSLSATPLPVYCGGTATLTAIGNSPSISYTWTPQAGGTALTGNPVTTPPLFSSTTYNIIASKPGCPSIQQQITVNVIPNISIQITPTTVCPGDNFTLSVNGSVPPSPPNIFRWLNASNVLVSTAVSPILTAPLVPGSYTYRLQLNNSNNCLSNTANITVQSSFSLSIVPSSTNICNNQTFTLTANGAPPGTIFTWSGPGLTSTTGNPVTAINTAAGIYNYSVTATPASGCAISASIPITVNSNGATIPTISVTSPNGVNLCPNQTTSLCATAILTPVSAGDIAIIRFRRSTVVNNRDISFVALRRIAGGTIINFSNETGIGFNYTVPAAGLNAGQRITLSGSTLNFNPDVMILASSGGTNLYAVVTNTSFAVPAGLTIGSTAVRLPNNGGNNGFRYQVNFSGTSIAALASISTVTNWINNFNPLATLNITGGTIIPSLVWNAGTNTGLCNGTFSAGINISSAGVYTVTNTNQYGCTASASQTITLLPSLQFNVNPVAPLYCGGSATLSASTNVPGAIFTWTPQGGGSALIGNPVSTPGLTSGKTYLVTGSAPGTYCPGPQQNVTVQILNTPSIQVVGSSTINCSGTFNLAINGTIPPSPQNTFEWIQSPSGTVVGINSTYSSTITSGSSSTQTLLFNLRLNGNTFCNSNTVNVTVNPCPNCNTSNLTPKWATYFGGSGFDEISEIAVKSNNNIVVLGNTDGAAQNLPTTGGTIVRNLGTPSGSGFGEVFLAEISANGQSVLWIDYIRLEAPANVVSMALDKTDDNIYLAIQHASGSLAPYDYIYSGGGGTQQNSLLRLNATGAVTWRKQYFMSGTMQVLASGNDGHLYIGGSAFGLGGSPNIADLPAVFNGGQLAQPNVTSGDMFVMKVTKANATDVWTQLLDFYKINGGTNPCSQSSETANKIIQGSLGEIYICGAQSDNNCQGGGFATKGLAYNVRQNGSIGWAKLYTGTQAFDQYTGICEDQNTLALVGLRNAVGFGPNGLIGSDIYLERLVTTTGNSLFSRVIGGSDTDVQYAITSDGYGKVYVTGYTASNNILSSFQSVNGGVTAYHSTHTSYQPLAPSPVNSQDIFVGRFAGSDFIPDWFTYYGSSTSVKSNQNNDIGYNVVLDNNGNVYVVGSTRSLDLETPNPLQPGIFPSSIQDGAIIKLGCTNGLRESDFVSENSLNEKLLFFVYPNPFSSSFAVSLPEDKAYELELIDSKGNKIFAQSGVINATEILIRGLDPGLYNLRLSDAFETKSHKLIKIE